MAPNPSERLLFVECNGANGRPSRVVRPLLSRHVMGSYVTTNSYHSGEIIFEDQKQITTKDPSACRKRAVHRKARPAKTLRDQDAVKAENRRTDQLPLSAIGQIQMYVPPLRALSGSGHQREEELAKWWFYCGHEISAPFQAAHYHWATAAWDLTRHSNFFQECLKLYAWRKRAQLTGNADRYIAQQLYLIRRIKHNIVEHGPHLESEPFALVAVAILSYVALLDADLETSATHLHALRAFDLSRHFKHSKQGWLYMVWVDFRFSLIQAIPPVLEYFVPLAFRLDLPPLSNEEESKMLSHVCRNSTRAPCSTLFDDIEMRAMFLKLHRLYGAWSSSQDTDFLFPLYGLLYDLEYQLRVIHARLRQVISGSTSNPNDEAVHSYAELILITIQLHVWIVSRHWAPVSSPTRRTILHRACTLISQTSASDLVSTWKRAGDIGSLIWCLSTVAAFLLEFSVSEAIPVIQTLQHALDSLGLFTHADLSELLQEWLWHDNWHPSKLEVVWTALEEHDIDEICAKFDGLQKQKSCFYVGAVEFYNV